MFTFTHSGYCKESPDNRHCFHDIEPYDDPGLLMRHVERWRCCWCEIRGRVEIQVIQIEGHGKFLPKSEQRVIIEDGS